MTQEGKFPGAIQARSKFGRFELVSLLMSPAVEAGDPIHVRQEIRKLPHSTKT